MIPYNNLEAQNYIIRDALSYHAVDVIESGQYVSGKKIEMFENSFARYCGAKHCVALDSGTSALVISILAVSGKKKIRVAIPNLSFVATMNAVIMAGCTPVFIDVDRRGCISVEELKRRINDYDCIMPVHLYGQCADMDAIVELARKRKIPVVEDACQAHGNRILGAHVGTYGEVGAFSFYPTKNLGALGDAGAIITNNDDIAEFARVYRNHGSISHYNHVMLGDTARMDAIQASMLSWKLTLLEEWNSERQSLARVYDSQLVGLKEISIGSTDSVYHIYPIYTGYRDELKDYLKKAGVETSIHYPYALSDIYNSYESRTLHKDWSKAAWMAQTELSLPLYPTLGTDRVFTVCEHIRKFFR